MILIIKHIDIEGPETIGEYFKSQGYSLKVIDLSLGDSLPADLANIEAVVVLGGPMNVYEEDKYPFLKEENIFIKKVLKKRIPYLGICLGAQLLAKACGAKVTQSPVKEIGWFKVELTEEGKKDSFFTGLSDKINVFQWHGDTFAIPDGGKWLGRAKGCVHQAFKVGPNAYGVQFHFEITDKSIKDWSSAYFKGKKTLKIRKQAMLNKYRLKKHIFHQMGNKMCHNFLELVDKKKPAKENQISFIRKKESAFTV
jgi:GMP synthase-like glutamine amidotransferase